MSLFFRNLFFTLLQPGIVVGLIPYLIVGRRIRELWNPPFDAWQWIALVLFGIGFIIMTLCIVSFGLVGRGTLSPVDPTKKLVVKGLYRYSRNPMYVGVLCMLVGEVVFFRSAMLGLYTAGVFGLFNLFIRYIEEPRLMRDFGSQYDAYRERVRKWI